MAWRLGDLCSVTYFDINQLDYKCAILFLVFSQIKKEGIQWAHHSLWCLKTQCSVVLVALSCPTLCNHLGCSPPGSCDHGVLQARILERVANPFLQGIFPTQGLNAGSPALQEDSLSSELPGKSLRSQGIPDKHVVKAKIANAAGEVGNQEGRLLESTATATQISYSLSHTLGPYGRYHSTKAAKVFHINVEKHWTGQSIRSSPAKII